MRINRFIASCTDVSRRKADQLIKNGKVILNGKIVTDFVNVDIENDVVELNGERLSVNKIKYYFAFNKPPFVLSAAEDMSERKVVCDYFRDIGTKLICVGRLDYLSEGLLLITNDGDFANLIMHPRFKIRKTYLIKTKNRLDKDKIKKMSSGIHFEDGFFKPLNINLTHDPMWVVISINSGRNRILRRFLNAHDVPISKLKRIAVENIELGNLTAGEYRNISTQELTQIRKIASNYKII